jgi:hypothetical protein
MKTPKSPTLPLPKSGHLRTWWRAPASPTALACFVARAAESHAGPVVVVVVTIQDPSCGQLGDEPVHRRR